MTPHPLYRSLSRLRATIWRRRVLHWLVRSTWLTLLVPVLVIGGYYWRGWEIRATYLIWGMVGVAGLVILWAVRPIRLSHMVSRLDRRLDLQTRLTTAHEVTDPDAAADAENPVVQRLLQETVEIVTHLRRQVSLTNRTFWLELRTLIGVAALLMALIALDTFNPRLPTADRAELPLAWEEPTAEEILSPEVELGPPPFQASQQIGQAQIQAALEALADALRDQAATRAVADALDQGDVAGAAEELRRLADRLDQLSEQAQQEIGQALADAAGTIGDTVPGLTAPLDSGSEALGQGDLLGAGEALEALAEALDSLGQAPQEVADQPQDQQGGGEPQADGEPADTQPAEEPPAEDGAAGQTEEESGDQGGTGDGAGDGAGGDQPSEAERLAAEGEPLELEFEDQGLDETVLQPSELEAEPGDKVTQDSPFARQPNSNPGDLGPDPLVYPWEKRDVIRSYFTPNP